ncbi:unnamed protein product [Caretta caretta]
MGCWKRLERPETELGMETRADISTVAMVASIFPKFLCVNTTWNQFRGVSSERDSGGSGRPRSSALGAGGSAQPGDHSDSQ